MADWAKQSRKMDKAWTAELEAEVGRLRDRIAVNDATNERLRADNERLRALLDPDNEERLERLHRIVYDVLVEWQIGAWTTPPAQKIVDRLLAALREEANDE